MPRPTWETELCLAKERSSVMPKDTGVGRRVDPLVELFRKQALTYFTAETRQAVRDHHRRHRSVSTEY